MGQLNYGTIVHRVDAAWQAGDMEDMGRWVAYGFDRHPQDRLLHLLWAEWQLLIGNWSREVWAVWDALRWHTANPGVRSDFHMLKAKWPLWDGQESLAPDPITFPEGVPIFIWNDGGHGDIVCFARFLPLLEAMGAKVIWQRRADLMPGWDSGKLSVACFACLQSLPGLMGVTPDTIPSPASFLFPKPEGQRWPPRRIACAWEGNPNMPNDVHRSIYKEQPDHWRNLPFEWVELPKGGDWRPTVELLRTCDLLISVDTGPMHLAGTLGIPVWCALSRMHYPIYLHDGSALPKWYPSVRVFLQRTARVWDDVIQAMERELLGFVARRSLEVA